MKNFMRLLSVLALAGMVLFVTDPNQAAAQEVQSLRGNVDVEEAPPPPKTPKLITGDRFTKNYRQQPPLIPHKVSKYEIGRKVNQCLRCHDWPQNVKEKAPKVSETHYIDREGRAQEHIARTRWFCTQCHVPQENAPTLVDNTFEPLKRAQ